MQEPTFVGTKFLGDPKFSGTKKFRGPNEIGDHFSYNPSIPYLLTVQMTIPYNKLPCIELSTFKCDDCRLEFFSIGTKSIHDDLYHNTIISKLFTCKFCLYATVSSRDYFNHHQENHTSMYEFIACFHQYWIYEFCSRNFFCCFLKADNVVTDRTFGLAEQFGQISTVWFGPNERTFFCRTQNFFLSYILKMVTLGL